jgi:glutamate decarboxylase
MDALEVVEGAPRLPLAIAKVREEEPFDARDLVGELAQRRGWLVPAYGLPPANDDQLIIRMLVKMNQTRELVDRLVGDFHDSIKHLRERGAVNVTRHHVHSGHGY